VSVVDREEPEASRSEWHANGTAGENGRGSGDGRGPFKATRASLAWVWCSDTATRHPGPGGDHHPLRMGSAACGIVTMSAR
jgi:hypothetical protein